MDLGLKTLRECRTDGRAKYFRYRQRQLISIYNAIHGNRNDFISALKTDLGKSAFEAELEVTVTLRNLQVMYEGTDFTTLTERVKKLRTGGKIPTPFGAALIVAHETAPLETAVGPLSAAIAAGNVALVLFPQQAGSLERLCSKLFFPSLDSAAYVFQTASENNISDALKQPFDVYLGTVTNPSTRKMLSESAASASAPCHLLPVVSKPEGQNIAVVSKTVPRDDLPRIARLLVRASFCAYSGRSLGALSFVCVHEELHDDLTRHLADAASDFASSKEDYSTIKAGSVGDIAPARPIFGDLSGRCILEKVPVSSALLEKAIEAPILPVVPITSTEEFIKIAQARLGNVLSVFADELETDYFATELKPHILVANELPLEMLVGICPSAGWDDSTPAQRWPSGLFERPITVKKAVAGPAGVFPPFAAWKVEAMRKALLPHGVEALKLKLKPHSNIIRRVFFLQGLFLSLALVLGSVVTVGGFGGWRLYRMIFRS